MIVHKTFSKRRGMTARQIQEAQEEVRSQAEAFIAQEVDPGDVLTITESPLVLPLTNSCLFSVTVWYRKH